jgi:hypothetical protein
MHDLHDRLKPLGRVLNLKQSGWTVWDCSPIYGGDGQVHVFAARWPDNDRPDKTWFLGGSQIIHAVAPTPTGPYEVSDVIATCDGSDTRWNSSGVINPKIYRVGNLYCLIYTGCTARRIETQAIGMLTASSLDGPWTQVSELAPIVDQPGICNNPALLQHPNGQFWIYYKGGFEGVNGMNFGLAIANHLEGPYLKFQYNPLIDEKVIKQHRKLEDPYVWHNENGFWLLCNKVGTEKGPAGLLFHSSDGIVWDPPVAGYPNPIDFSGHRQRLEEPNLLFRDGKPTHLFNIMGACLEDPVYSGFVFAIEDL